MTDSTEQEHEGHFGGTLSFRPKLKIKVRRGQPVEIKQHIEKTIRREYARDRGQWEKVEATYDHEAGTYEEVYFSLETGEDVFRKSGAISDQGLHGPRGKSPS